MTEQEVKEKPVVIQCPYCLRFRKNQEWHEPPSTLTHAILHGNFVVAPKTCEDCEAGSSNRLIKVKEK